MAKNFYIKVVYKNNTTQYIEFNRNMARRNQTLVKLRKQENVKQAIPYEEDE